MFPTLSSVDPIVDMDKKKKKRIRLVQDFLLLYM